jgi:hypothetical protein
MSNTKETIAEHSMEPVVGHRIDAEIHSKENDDLQKLSAELGIDYEPREYVTITVGDIAWDESKSVQMRREWFEQLIEWYDNE